MWIKPSISTVLEVLAATSALIYLYLAWLYQRFYGAFGIAPERVGLDRPAIIGRALGFGLICTVSVVFFVVGAGLFVLQRRTPHVMTLRSDGSPAPTNLEVVSDWLTRILAGVLLLSLPSLITVVFPFTELPGVVDKQAAEVRAGSSAEPPTGLYGVPLLDIRVQDAYVDWVADTKPPSGVDCPRLLYFGHDSSTVSLRLPSQTLIAPLSDVVLHLGAARVGGPTPLNPAMCWPS